MFDLSPAQIAAFDHDGYLVLRNWIPADLLKGLQEASHTAISEHLSRADDKDGRVLTAQNTSGPSISRIDQLFREPDPVFLELLGCPAITSIAQALIGPSWLTTYESLLVKNEADESPIDWHRDMLHSRKGRILTLGIYLDPSRTGQGALRVLPATQKNTEDLCVLLAEWKAGIRPAVEIEMEPGDVLLHDVMLAHSSETLSGQAQRRTLYFELRSVADAEANPGFEPKWIEMRQELITHAMAQSQEAVNEHPSEAHPVRSYDHATREFTEKLYSAWSQIEKGHYCFPHIQHRDL